jgi:hypothetical protein
VHAALAQHGATTSTGSSLSSTGWTSATPTASSNCTSNTQLAADIAQLRTDIAAIQSQSSVTMGQMESVRADFVSLAHSGLFPDRQGLATFEHDLLTAVAESRSAGNNGMLTWTTTRALETELGTAFGSSVLASIELSQLYNDMLAIAQNSNITMANITTITGDQAKIAADLDAVRTTDSATTTTLAGYSGDEAGGGGDAASLATASISSLLVPEFTGLIRQY